MIKKSALIATASLMLLLSLIFGAVQIVSANPISLPLAHVNSPENNKIYPSNQVELNFSVAVSYPNFTSFSYSLDGQDPIDTNQSCILTNLPPGDHALIIYGNSTDDTYWNGYEVLTIVYFSTTYSTAWITFALIMSASLAILVPLLFFGRKRIATRLKGEKKASFWLGLLCFLFFTVFGFIPSFGIWAYDYLLPRFGGPMFFPIFGILISIPFMVLGYLLMWFGTRKGKSRFESKVNEFLEKPSAMDFSP